MTKKLVLILLLSIFCTALPGATVPVYVDSSDGSTVSPPAWSIASDPSSVGDFDASAWRTDLNVEDGATADQTGAEIKSLYEAEADTNAFTDANQTDLGAIQSDPSTASAFSASAWRTDLVVYTQTEVDDKIQAVQEGVHDPTANLTATDGVIDFRMPFSMTVSEIKVSATEAPTGSSITAHVEKNGVNILTTDLSIDDGELTSRTASTPAVIGESTFTDDDRITVDVSQIGSTTAGKGLHVYLIGNQVASGSSFLNQYSDSLEFAYAAKDIGNRTGVEDSVINPVFRVRRDLDDALRSFTWGEVTDGTMLTWVGNTGTDNGFIHTLYDVGGSGNHATQTVTGDQPNIITAGVVESDPNSNIGPHMDGTDAFFNTTSSAVLTGEFTLFFIAEHESTGIRTIIGNQSSVNPRVRVENTNSMELTNDAGTEINISFDSPLAATTTYMLTVHRDASNVVRVYIDGALQTDTDTLAGTITYDRVMARDFGSNPWSGGFSCMLLYSDTVDRFAIESELDSFFF